MDLKDTPIHSRYSPPADPGTEASVPLGAAHNPRIPERWLAASRVVWWVVVLGVILLTAASIPVGFARSLPDCPQAYCNFLLTSGQLQQLQNLGLPQTFFAYFYTTLLVLVSAFYLFVAFLLFQRRSAGWIGYLGAITLVVFGTMTAFRTSQLLSLAYPALWIPVNILDYIGVLLLPLFFLSFPDGYLKPRWSIVLVAAWAVLRFPSYFFPKSRFDLNIWPLWIQVLLWAIFIGALVLAQYYRYRHQDSPELRQQTKWVVYGLMVAMGGVLAVRASSALLPPPVLDNVLVIIIKTALVYLLMMIIPASFAIAILRYKLWDIDLIINRTLVYISLTAIVGGLYSASVTLFQKVFVATTGAKSDSALVLTTFLLVATFTPIKNGLQAVVDRRFKDSRNPLQEISALVSQVRSVIEVLDTRSITQRLLDTAVTAFSAAGGAVYLERGGRMVLAQATPGWSDGDRKVSLPLEWNGRQLGLLSLAAREGGLEYSSAECQALQQAADLVARAIAGLPSGQSDFEP